MGVPAKVNPCLARFMETKEYHDICVKYNFTETCYPNAFFAQADREQKLYDLPTNEQTDDCSNGYCPCPDSNATTTSSEAATTTNTASVDMMYFSGASHQMVSGVIALLLISIMIQ